MFGLCLFFNTLAVNVKPTSPNEIKNFDSIKLLDISIKRPFCTNREEQTNFL